MIQAGASVRGARIRGAGIRGWCPSLHEAMEAGDGLLVRIKPKLSRLSPAQALGIAEASSRFGNGLIGVTGRANLQPRGFGPTSLQGFIDRMRALGLATEPAIERVRNIAVSPLLGTDPTIDGGTETIAQALLDGLAGAPGLRNALSGKFAFAVDGGGALPLQAGWADITLRATASGWLVIPTGATRAALVPLDQAASAALALAATAVDLAATAGLSATRMSRLVEAGHEDRLFAGAGLTARATPPSIATQAAAPGMLSLPGTDRTAVLTTPRFGQMDAVQFAGLATLADRAGCVWIGLAPSRLLILSPLTRDRADATCEGLAGLGFITEPGAPPIVACQGAPRCASGLAATQEDAAKLAIALRRPFGTLHVSGCTKGCAHPGAATLTLAGGADGYDLILDGTAAATPAFRGLTLAAAIDAINQLHASTEAAPCRLARE